MHRLAYIFPLLTIGALVLLFRNYDLWWIYLIMAVVSELLLWLIMRRASRTQEYLSGYALNVQHHEPWVERVERTETYTDSRGNTRTRRMVDYRYHPDVWVMPLNTGNSTYISSAVYNHYRALRSIGSTLHISTVSAEAEGNFMNGMGCMKIWQLIHTRGCISTM